VHSRNKRLSSTRLGITDMKIPLKAQIEYFLKVIKGEEHARLDDKEE
jgi:hypothetical protein